MSDDKLEGKFRSSECPDFLCVPDWLFLYRRVVYTRVLAARKERSCP
jgi:hypothetical protein